MSGKIYNEEKEEPPDSPGESIDQSELSFPAPPNVKHKPVKSLSKSFYSDLQVSQAGDIITTGEWKVGRPRSEEISKANLTVSFKSRKFRQQFFPEASDIQWNDWRWQIRNRIKDLAGLERIVHLSSDERDAILHHSGALPVAITPYYASLVDPNDPQQPIRRSVIMVGAEYQVSSEESIDPLAEDEDSPVPGLVHRYPDRVLFLTTGFCAVYCRYCTRSRLVGNLGAEHRFNTQNWEKSIAYLEAHKEVRDVILSGGDPLTLGNNKLEWLLKRLRRIPHLEVIRLGTKVPVVLPQRITNSFVNMLKQFHPLWMSIHFTHPDELTPETIQACNRLADAGLPLGSQTVLLKGINDNVGTMKRLTQGLMKTRVKPYYLYQCDPVKGSSHFRTSVDKGLEIIAGLRGFTSGYAVPSFVIDSPGGGGKIPLLPEYVVGRDGDDLLLRNYEGKIFRYPDSGGTIGKNIQNHSE
ncbi:MAG: KamA family radical SAM protein [Candidatus Marinimicrobia bacterium]|nr:KamA family radical SAM protein [Candidatus Neomarinimicrobiota bacterium]